MTDRRGFIATSFLAPALLAALPGRTSAQVEVGRAVTPAKLTTPCVISTWDYGVVTNQAAWAVLSKGGRALDAVEAGARVPEADLRNHSVERAASTSRPSP